MFETLKNAFKVKEIRIKIYWTLLFLLLYRVGCYIPVPGIGDQLFSNTTLEKTSYLNIMSMMTGGSLTNGTLFAMGIGPYINASIIMQLLAVAIPPLERLSKQGEEGRKKISAYTRYLAIILAIVQSIGILVSYGELAGGNASLSTIISGGKVEGNTWFPDFLSYVIIILFYTAGSAITIWIGERITDYGVSNGISLLIFAGIIASAGIFFGQQISIIFADGGFDRLNFLWLIIYVLIVVIVFAAIVYVDLAERKISVQYAKQVKGRKTYGGQSNCIPVRVNGSGVIPIIFASALLSFPYMLISMFWPDSVEGYNQILGAGTWLYIILTAVLILFFSYFQAQITFKPEDISKNIQQSGGFINGVRPGKDTTAYLSRVSKRVTLFGAIFLAFIALVPSVVFNLIGGNLSSTLTGAFSATGMMIVVSVALEFQKQLEAQMITRNYKGFLN